MNGGTCTDGINRYTCACLPGYTGRSCATSESICSKLVVFCNHTSTVHLVMLIIVNQSFTGVQIKTLELQEIIETILLTTRVPKGWLIAFDCFP